MHYLVGLAAAIYIGSVVRRVYLDWYWKRRAERTFAPGSGLTRGVKKRINWRLIIFGER